MISILKAGEERLFSNDSPPRSLGTRSSSGKTTTKVTGRPESAQERLRHWPEGIHVFHANIFCNDNAP